MSRMRMVQYHSDLGQGEMVTRLPAPPLRAYVRSYQGYTERTTGAIRRLETPSSDVVLIISLGPALQVIDPRDKAASALTRSAFVAGLYESYVFVESKASCGLQVNFTPIGAHLFFGLPMNRLTNRVVELEDLFGSMAHRLMSRLYETPTWAVRFSLLDSLITARLAEADLPSPRITWTWQRLQETGGSVRISTLANALGCSQKYLIAQFREQIGLPPKVCARIVRFNRVLQHISHKSTMSWAEIALVCGYYDQAHCNRDFHKFAGCTPGEFLLHTLPNGFGIIGD